jgi:hypothetical protein
MATMTQTGIIRAGVQIRLWPRDANRNNTVRTEVQIRVWLQGLEQK